MFSSKICENFKNTFSTKHFQVTASAPYSVWKWKNTEQKKIVLGLSLGTVYFIVKQIFQVKCFNSSRVDISSKSEIKTPELLQWESFWCLFCRLLTCICLLRLEISQLFDNSSSVLFNMWQWYIIEPNWSCKYMKKVRGSQASISNNSCTELNKTQFFPVSLVCF